MWRTTISFQQQSATYSKRASHTHRLITPTGRSRVSHTYPIKQSHHLSSHSHSYVRLFSTQSWRPGGKGNNSFDAGDDANEDEEERQRRLEYHRIEQEYRAQQANRAQKKEGQQATNETEQQRRQQERDRRLKEEAEAKAKAEEEKHRRQQQQQQQQSKQEENTSPESILRRLHASNPKGAAHRAKSSSASESDPSTDNAAGQDADQQAEPLRSSPPSEASSTTSLPTLKAQLRRFFLQIHPDLFESHPNEKDLNAKNLALLQDFVDTLKKGGSSSSGLSQQRGGSKTAQVKFWIKAKDTTSTSSSASVSSSSSPIEATFYQVSSTLTLQPNAFSSPATRIRAQQSLYTSLSSLFKQAGLLHANNWRWGDDFELGHAASEAAESDTSASGDEVPYAGRRGDSPFTSDAYDDDYFNRFNTPSSAFGITGEFEQFLRSVRAAAHHYAEVAKQSKHESLLRAANLRLQGLKLVFEDDWSLIEQDFLLKLFERTLQSSKHYRAPKPLFNPGEKVDLRGDSSSGASPGRPHGPSQPNTPFSQTVSMPAGMEAMLRQVKKHQIREEQEKQQQPASSSPSSTTADIPQGLGAMFAQIQKGHARETGQALDSTQSPPSSSSSSSLPASDPAAIYAFESTRSPFSRVVSIFSSSSPTSHIDGRGRLVFSLNENESQWKSFIHDPNLITRATERADHYRALKTFEKHVAEATGLFDVFAELSLIQGINGMDGINPAYVEWLTRLERDSHLLSSLRSVFPDYVDISLRVSVSPTGEPNTTPANECFTVDPMMGILLVPLHADVNHIRQAILERGQECVQIKRMHAQDVSDHAASLLHAKRHLKLRSLVASPSITRDQMREATERLSRVYGSMRDLLQGTSISVGEDYECLEEDGTICIKWNWS